MRACLGLPNKNVLFQSVFPPTQPNTWRTLNKEPPSPPSGETKTHKQTKNKGRGPFSGLLSPDSHASSGRRKNTVGGGSWDSDLGSPAKGRTPGGRRCQGLAPAPSPERVDASRVVTSCAKEHRAQNTWGIYLDQCVIGWPGFRY